MSFVKSESLDRDQSNVQGHVQREVTPRELLIFTNQRDAGGAREFANRHSAISVLEYREIPDLPDPDVDAVVVVGEGELAAGAALLDELLATRSADSEVRVVFSVLPSDVDLEALESQLRGVFVSRAESVEGRLAATVSRQSGRGSLSAFLWGLAEARRCHFSPESGRGEAPRSRNGGSVSESKVTPEKSQRDRPVMRRPESGRVPQPDFGRIRSRISLARPRVVVGLAVVVSGLVGIGLGFFTANWVTGLGITFLVSILATLLVLAAHARRVLIFQGREVARLHALESKRARASRRSLNAQRRQMIAIRGELERTRRLVESLQVELRNGRAANAILLESLAHQQGGADLEA